MKKGVFFVGGILAVMLLQPIVARAETMPSVSSLSAVLYEPQSGRFLYEKDGNTRRPMASTTKLMTALVAADLLPMDQTVTVPEKAVLVEGSSMGLRGGDCLSVRDLLTGMLLSSGNDAANAVALVSCGSLPAFSHRMNEKAAHLGMYNSVFVTPSGLDEGEHGSTARDMALLGAAVLQNEELARICSLKSATVHIGNPARAVPLSNHNRLLKLYEPTIGLKTGFTKKSGRCLVSAARQDGVTLVVASLNGGDYWNDHMALYRYGFSLTQSCELTVPSLPAMSVCGGTESAVSLVAEHPSEAVLLKTEIDRVRCEIRLPAFVWAPVEEGQILGEAVYLVDERILHKMPLKAQRAVPARAAWSFTRKWWHQLRLLLTEWIG